VTTTATRTSKQPRGERRRRATTAPGAGGEARALRALADAADRYAAVQAAIAAVHTSASILIGATGTLLAGALALASTVTGAARVVLAAGVAALLAALVAGGATIFPRLRARAAAHSLNALYFGELRRWTVVALADWLTYRTPAERLVDHCQQVTVVASIAWGKYRAYRAALVAAGTGTALVLAAYVLGVVA